MSWLESFAMLKWLLATMPKAWSLKKSQSLGGIWPCGWDEHSTRISKYSSCLPELLAVVLAQWRGISHRLLAVHKLDDNSSDIVTL